MNFPLTLFYQTILYGKLTDLYVRVWEHLELGYRFVSVLPSTALSAVYGLREELCSAGLPTTDKASGGKYENKILTTFCNYTAFSIHWDLGKFYNNTYCVTQMVTHGVHKYTAMAKLVNRNARYTQQFKSLTSCIWKVWWPWKDIDYKLGVNVYNGLCPKS